jgi:hypothetical protein
METVKPLEDVLWDSIVDQYEQLEAYAIFWWLTNQITLT